MRQSRSSVVLTVVCGAMFLMPGRGWTAEPSPAVTPPEPVGEVREDIAWVQATTGHPPVPGDKTYSLRDATTGLGWALPPHVLEGFLEQEVDELSVVSPTRYEATPAYRAATEVNAGRARLRLESEPYGELVEEVGGKVVPYRRVGLPFPDISPTDPQAGRKVVQNFIRADRGGGRAGQDIYVYVLGAGNGSLAHEQTVPSGFTPLWTEQAHGTVVRRLTVDMLYAQLEHDTSATELRKTRFDFVDPPDMKDNKLVALRSLNPVELQRGFMYMRETRKATAAAMPKMNELFAGTHFPLDLFWGWDGLEYYWNFQLVGEAFVPAIVRSQLPNPRFTGRWGSIPDNTDNWELRRSFAVLAQSREEGNPFPYRLMFFDKEMQLVNMVLLYDKDGRFAGTFQATYFQDAPTGLPMGSALVLRLRNNPDASVVFFHRERTCITENTPDKLELFSPASLLAGKTIRGYLDSAGYLARSTARSTAVSMR